MKDSYNSEEGGIIINTILVIIVLIGLKYLFNFDVITYLKQPKQQQIIQAVWGWIKAAYNWLDATIRHALGK